MRPGALNCVRNAAMLQLPIFLFKCTPAEIGPYLNDSNLCASNTVRGDSYGQGCL